MTESRTTSYASAESFFEVEYCTPPEEWDLSNPTQVCGFGSEGAKEEGGSPTRLRVRSEGTDQPMTPKPRTASFYQSFRELNRTSSQGSAANANYQRVVYKAGRPSIAAANLSRVMRSSLAPTVPGHLHADFTDDDNAQDQLRASESKTGSGSTPGASKAKTGRSPGEKGDNGVNNPRGRILKSKSMTKHGGGGGWDGNENFSEGGSLHGRSDVTGKFSNEGGRANASFSGEYADVELDGAEKRKGFGDDYDDVDENEGDWSVMSGGAGLCGGCVPLRYAVVMALFLGMVVVNAMRTNIGVTVVTILNRASHARDNRTGMAKEIPKVHWDAMEIGYLHAVFFFGYLVSHLPAGYLTTRLPCHMLLGACVFVSSGLNMTLPAAFEVGGYWVTLAVRGVQGLSEGLVYPSLYGILRHWSTPQERGKLGSLVLTGAYLGPCVGFPMAGMLTEYIGWQYVYYVNGGFGVLFAVLWAWFSEEKPAHHKRISADELSFIEDLQGSERIDYEDTTIPWSEILLSPPVLSLCLCNFARNWVFVLMLTNEPFYLDMFHFTILQNGLFSALPQFVKMLASLTSGIAADCLIQRRLLSTTGTRKLLTSGFGVQAAFFVLLTQTHGYVVAMVCLSFAVGVGGFVVSGWQLNHYDLSTRFASVLVAVTSTFGNLASTAAPIMAGVLTSRGHKNGFKGWHDLFYITAGISGVAFLSYILFGSGERQAWSAGGSRDGTPLIAKEDSKRRARTMSSRSRSYSRSPASPPEHTPSPLQQHEDQASSPLQIPDPKPSPSYVDSPSLGGSEARGLVSGSGGAMQYGSRRSRQLPGLPSPRVHFTDKSLV